MDDGEGFQVRLHQEELDGNQQQIFGEERKSEVMDVAHWLDQVCFTIASL